MLKTSVRHSELSLWFDKHLMGVSCWFSACSQWGSTCNTHFMPESRFFRPNFGQHGGQRTKRRDVSIKMCALVRLEYLEITFACIGISPVDPSRLWNPRPYRCCTASWHPSNTARKGNFIQGCLLYRLAGTSIFPVAVDVPRICKTLARPIPSKLKIILYLVCA